MSTVRSSIVYSSLNSWSTVVFQLASTVVLARILTPEQTGIFAVAAVFAALASTFRDFGVGEYLIQEKNLTPDVIRAALTVNIATSWAMGALLFVLAPIAGSFYAAAGVTDVMRVQAVNFLLIPFGAVTMAWFRREMNFKPILVVGLVANGCAFVVAIIMALRGFGFMSLAWSSLVGTVLTVAGSVWVRPAGFPKWPGLRGVSHVVHFGKFASGIYIFGQLGKGAPEMILGRALNMSAVGMFSRASGLIEIFNRLVLRAVHPVCLPYFSNSVRQEGTPVRGMLVTMSYLTVIGWTFLGFMAVAAFSAVRLLYGRQWMEAISLAQILCAAAAFELLYCMSKEAMLSLGKAKESNLLQMATEGLRILGLLAVIPFGLEGACWGLLAAAALGAVVAHLTLRAHIGLQARDVGKAVWPSLCVAGLAGLPMFAWTRWMPITEGNYLRVAVAGAIVTTVLWFVCLRALRHPLWLEVQSASAGAMRKFVSFRSSDR